jgi:predicted RNA binding protein YcfA (HicA-like mRNA interferase family)
VTSWPSTKARRVYAALVNVGWQLKRQSGSHRTLSRPSYPDLVFAFHDGDEIGPKMLARIAKHAGITQMTCRNEMPNNTFERTEEYLGPRLTAARSSWPAAQLGR